MITTVCGEIRGEQLGLCQMHEHILLRRGVPASLNPALCAEEPEKSREEVRAFAEAGGNAVVDAQPIGCGRMPSELARIAVQTGVHIVASTGFHLRRFYAEEHWLFTLSERELEELFCRELCEGMYENADVRLDGIVTDRRAGLIKTACEGDSLSETQRRLFTAAAFAARICQVPLMIHTEPLSHPLALFNDLTGLGVPPERMIFCHLDRAIPEESVAYQLCREGAYVEYDTIGRFKYHSDEKEIRLIGNLLERGFEKQLLLSLDTTRQRMLAYGGEIGLTYLLHRFLPALRRAGVSEDVLRGILAENPRRVLERSASGKTEAIGQGRGEEE
ncbi:MAG: phosphotriesterase [Lachnospiraceae bacterium]|nr:phosphotriesterase [Lachnospiraceae bacterium]